jgi:hypothetical protein
MKHKKKTNIKYKMLAPSRILTEKENRVTNWAQLFFTSLSDLHKAYIHKNKISNPIRRCTKI